MITTLGALYIGVFSGFFMGFGLGGILYFHIGKSVCHGYPAHGLQAEIGERMSRKSTNRRA